MKDLKEFLEKAMLDYTNKCQKVINASLYKCKENIESLKPTDLLREEENIKEYLYIFSNISFPTVYSKSKMDSLISRWFELNMADYQTTLAKVEKKKVSLNKKILSDFEDEKNTLQNEYSQKMREYKDKLDELYSPIYYLQENKNTIEKFASEFNIDLDLYTINYQKMSLKEIIDISNLTRTALDEIIEGRKGFNSMLRLLYLPLIWKPFEDKLYDTAFKGFYLLLIIILISVSAPYGIGIISLLIIVQALGNIIFIIKYYKLISVIYSLNNNFQDFDNRISELLSEEPSLKQLKEEYYKLCETDANERFKTELSSIEKELRYILESSPKEKLKAIIESEEIKSYTDELIASMNMVRSNFIEEYNKKVDVYNVYFKRINEEINRRSATALGPGIPVSLDYYMNFEFKSSAISTKDGRIIGYHKTSLPFKNILFQYDNELDKLDRINLIKLMLSSMIGNVRENFLDISIVDTEQIGRNFTEFLSKSIRGNVKLITKEWEKEFSNIVDIAKNNMLTIGTINFNEYNKINSLEGKITLIYKLIIIISTDKPLWNNVMFEEFKQYSTEMGVWIWLLHGKAHLYKIDKKVPEGLNRLLKFPVTISDSENYFYETNKHPLYFNDEFTVPISYSVEIGKSAVSNFVKTVNEGRIDVIDYENEYRLRHIPDDKIWTYSTLDGIELHFGFLDGDRSNPHIEWLGSDGVKPVHCLMVGETGAGKSATINQILANLLHMYSPEELELIMIDFKNVEFNMYTGNLLIPHAKLIAGTTDGEYGYSIFEYILKEMRRRQSEFAKYKFQNITDWNKAVLKGQINEKYMPRILAICDEFQVLFTEVDSKIVEQIKMLITSISKLARFAGCHLWFTSQSMKGTMSQDILDQFALRAALRSSLETSVDILGNDAAFKNLRGRGFIYTNSSKGDSNENHRYSIPYTSNEYIKIYLPKLIDKCKVENHIHRNADFYDEKKKHKINELDKWITNEEIKSNKAFMLGEKTYFSTNILPVNFILGQGDGEHIIIAGIDRDDRYNIVNTILYQIEIYCFNVIVSCPDNELSELLNLRKRIPEAYHMFIDDNTPDKIFELILKLIDARSKDNKKEWEPIFIMNLMWDKMIGIGIAEDYNMTDKYKEIIQKSGGYNIHFILSVRLVKAFNFVLPFFNHKICAKLDEDTSMKMLDNTKATKLSQDDDISRVAIYLRGIKEEKFKIYMSNIDKSKIKKESAVFLQQ